MELKAISDNQFMDHLPNHPPHNYSVYEQTYQTKVTNIQTFSSL